MISQRIDGHFWLWLTLIVSAHCNVISGQAPAPSGPAVEITIKKRGIYRVEGESILQSLALAKLPSDQLTLLGSSTHELDPNTSWVETERLQSIPLLVFDGGDGTIDQGDWIIFYAEGPHRRSLLVEDDPSHLNPYYEQRSYLLTLTSDEGLRIQTEELVQSYNPTDLYRYHSVFHVDEVNLLAADLSNQGSGRRWFGPELSNLKTFNLTGLWELPQSGVRDASIRVTFAGRSASGESLDLVTTDPTSSVKVSWPAVNTGDVEALHARIFSAELTTDQLGPDDRIDIQYLKANSEARLWLDYATIRGLVSTMENSDGFVNNLFAIEHGHDALTIPSGTQVLNISDPLRPKIRPTISVNGRSAIPFSTAVAEEFVTFKNFTDAPTPARVSAVVIEEIDTKRAVDHIIIAPPQLRSEAIRLAEHRESHSDVSTSVIDIDQVYRHYAAGSHDPVAIRNYLRDMVRNETGLRSVLLFGEGTYDYRHIQDNLPDHNLIPTFQTGESLDPLFAFPTDDFYALLDDGEGDELAGDLDIAIGRIPVSRIEEARIVVDKIINYDLGRSKDDAWRANIVFVADDEDRNLHINDADDIAKEVEQRHPLFNQRKIYFDAFRQQSTAGGNRYPDATARIDDSVDEGALVINYLGHGGPRGWAQERVLDVDAVTSWSNYDRLPLVITATCSFTGFDDPSLRTAGEQVLLNPSGGAVALLTTVRSVFASKNFRLTRAVFRNIFEREAGAYLTLGEIMRRSKNQVSNDALNGRKFFLIGDPSMTLALPTARAEITSINGIATTVSQLDTIGATGEVHLTGEILTPLGELDERFEGEVEINVFDKPSTVTTLANDPRSFPTTFDNRSNILHKARVNVNNGRFDHTWIVPVDIDYSLGFGKVSLFAQDMTGTQALGATEQLIIGGTEERSVQDILGPEIRGYLNDPSFVNGQIVPSQSRLFLELNDENGINISTAGIGHEITASLDGTVTILNSFYRPQSDGSGLIEFDLPTLSEGSHVLQIQAFDVLNNASQVELTFEVMAGAGRAFDVEISPNPIEDQINMQITTTSLSGRVVISTRITDLQGRLIQRSRQLNSITNGRILAAANVNPLSSGIYLIQVEMLDTDGKSLGEPIIKKVTSLK